MALNKLNLNALFFSLEQRRPTTVFVGFSGGVDSHVLLMLCAAFQKQSDFFTLKTIHVNHQLHAQADQWQVHCQAICDDLQVECLVEQANITVVKGSSLEALARDARYACFEKHVAPGDVVLTAHHQDDQAETVLLQLLRGAGPKGLAAMAMEKSFAKGYLQRPLLNCSQESIVDYAQENKLVWVEDSSNQDSVFRRNYLRHEVMPKLKKYWPECAKTLSRSAQLCAQADTLLEDQARELFENCQGDEDVLLLSKLLALEKNQQSLVLRYWLSAQSFPLPSQMLLTQIMSDVVLAKKDAAPCLRYAGIDIRRYGDGLYAQSSVEKIAYQSVDEWALQAPLIIANKVLQFKKIKGQGVALPKQAIVQVRFRQGGEALYIKGVDGQQKLKKLFQQWQVPPWLRDEIPLIYLGDVLVVVVGFASHRDYLVASEGEGFNFFWVSKKTY